MTKPTSTVLAVFLAGLLLQLGVLLAFQFNRQTALEQGRKIVVKAVPVDPRDLFRGDYVTLRYNFSRIDRAHIQDALGDMNLRGRKVYVRLKPPVGAATTPETNLDWRAVEVRRRPFAALAPDEIMLAGHIEDHSAQTLDINYGCETFFVPEGKGKPIEQKIREHQVTVELSVTGRGEAQPVKLFIDGQAVEFK